MNSTAVIPLGCILAWSAIIVTFAQVNAPLASRSQGRGPWIGTKTELPAGVTHRDYFSDRMQTTVGYCLYLPPNYEQSDESYRVIYFLHGAGSSEYTQNVAYVPYLDEAIRSGSLPPMILVFPNGGAFSFYSDSADGRLLSETTIIQELIPHIDKTWRTIPSREGRAIQGMSMGGFGALKLALKYPELFSSVVSIAGGFLTAAQMEKMQDSFGPIFGNDPDYFRRNDPLRLAAENRASILRARLSIALFIGQSDTNISGLNLLERNRAVHESLQQLGIPHIYEELPGVDHEVSKLSARLRARTFRFAAQNFSRPP